MPTDMQMAKARKYEWYTEAREAAISSPHFAADVSRLERAIRTQRTTQSQLMENALLERRTLDRVESSLYDRCEREIQGFERELHVVLHRAKPRAVR